MLDLLYCEGPPCTSIVTTRRLQKRKSNVSGFQFLHVCIWFLYVCIWLCTEPVFSYKITNLVPTKTYFTNMTVKKEEKGGGVGWWGVAVVWA